MKHHTTIALAAAATLGTSSVTSAAFVLVDDIDGLTLGALGTQSTYDQIDPLNLVWTVVDPAMDGDFAIELANGSLDGYANTSSLIDINDVAGDTGTLFFNLTVPVG